MSPGLAPPCPWWRRGNSQCNQQQNTHNETTDTPGQHRPSQPPPPPPAIRHVASSPGSSIASSHPSRPAPFAFLRAQRAALLLTLRRPPVIYRSAPGVAASPLAVPPPPPPLAPAPPVSTPDPAAPGLPGVLPSLPCPQRALSFLLTNTSFPSLRLGCSLGSGLASNPPVPRHSSRSRTPAPPMTLPTLFRNQYAVNRDPRRLYSNR